MVARILEKSYWLLGIVVWLLLVDHTNNTVTFTANLNKQGQKREVIFSINGTMSSYAGAAKAAEALEQKTARPVVVLYNRSKGLGIHDALETIAQKYRESHFYTPNDLFNVVGFFANILTHHTRTEDLKNFYAIYQQYLEQNYKIVIVAHSQGNFFANELYDLIARDSNTPKNAGRVCGFDVVAVSTPSSRRVASGVYFINRHDRPIGVLPTALPALEENSENYQKSEDIFHHEFVETYLEGDTIGPKMTAAIAKAFENMPYPMDCAPARDILALTPSSG